MNKSLFDKLYFGEYQPNDIVIISEAYDKLTDEISELESHFKKILSPSDNKLFDQLTNCYSQLNDEYARQSYTDGIKFASEFLFNALCGNNSGEK